MSQTPFPRMSAYLAGQSQGLAGHPEATAKGTLVRVNGRGLSLAGEQAAALPGEVAALFRQPPSNRAWIPEVASWSVLFASSDLQGIADPDFDDWVRQVNRELYANPVFRLVMGFTSPRLILPMAASYWTTMHHGSLLAVAAEGEGRARLVVAAAPGLFDALCARCLAQAFLVALQLSSAREPQVRVEGITSTQSTYLASWR